MALPRIPTDLRGRELWLMLARDQVGRELLREVDALLLDGFKEIVRRLVIDYPDLGPRDARRLAGLFRQVSDLLAERYGNVSATLTAHLELFGGIEARIAEDELALRIGSLGRLESSLGTLSRERLVAIADVLLEGRTMPAWWQLQAQRMSEATRRQVQIGLTLGESIPKIVRRIVPPRGSLDPAVYRRAKREATTLVRTAVTGVASEAQLQTLRAMDPRISDKYQWVAVRDARTSIICRALDGQVFRYDDPKAPRPPAHFNCRSSIIPVIDYKKLGIKPPANAGPGGWKDYESWLRAQPEDVQRKILGAGRWQLWKDGKVTLRDMVDSDGRTLTLEQLQKLAGVTTPTGPAPVPAPAPAPPAPPASPAMVSVMDRVDLNRLDPAARRDVERSLRAIDGLHEVPETAGTASFFFTPKRGGIKGGYNRVTRDIGLFEAKSRPGTTVHETGHFLDSQGLGRTDAIRQGLAIPPGDDLIYMSERTARGPRTGAWGQFWDAVERSQHYQLWQAMRGGSGGPALREHAKYMLYRRELFARAYEQWVALRLDNADPLKAVLRKQRNEMNQWYPHSWTDSDFTNVAAALERILKEAGWIRTS